MIEADLIAFLLADNAIGGLVSTRIQPLARPQGASLPSITLERIAGAPLTTADGDLGMSAPLIQVDCWGREYRDARAVAEAVRYAVSGYKGTMGASFVHSCTVESQRDMREAGANASEYLYCVSLDLLIYHTG